jgi:hypothetical protein
MAWVLAVAKSALPLQGQLKLLQLSKQMDRVVGVS